MIHPSLDPSVHDYRDAKAQTIVNPILQSLNLIQTYSAENEVHVEQDQIQASLRAFGFAFQLIFDFVEVSSLHYIHYLISLTIFDEQIRK